MRSNITKQNSLLANHCQKDFQMRRKSCNISQGDIQCPATLKGSCCSLILGHKGLHEHRYGNKPKWDQTISLRLAVKSLRTTIQSQQEIAQDGAESVISYTDILNHLDSVLDNSDE